MRALRRFFKRLIFWSTTQQDENRFRAEIEEHLALQSAENIRAPLSPVDTTSGGVEIWSCGGNEGRLSGSETIAAFGDSATG
jgi:hypothetical protein